MTYACLGCDTPYFSSSWEIHIVLYVVLIHVILYDVLWRNFWLRVTSQHAFSFILVGYHLWLCLFLGEVCSMRTPCFSIAFNLSWWLARFGSRRYYLHTLLYLFTVFLDIMRSRILLLYDAIRSRNRDVLRGSPLLIMSGTPLVYLKTCLGKFHIICIVCYLCLFKTLPL